jgi:hypothetical protein
VSFQPDARYQPLVPHTVTLTTGIRTPDGRSMIKNKTWIFTCDRTWGKQATVAGGLAAGSVADPWAVIDGNGDGHVAWRPYKSGQQNQIWYSRYDSGSQTWSAAVQVKDKADNYRLLNDGTGDVWLVWLERTSTTTSVFARQYDATLKTWQATRSTTLSLMASKFIMDAIGAAAHAGGVVVALHTVGPVSKTDTVHIVSYSSKTNTWTTPEAVITGQELQFPEVGTDQTGSKLVVGWYRMDGDLATRGFWVKHRGISSSGWSSAERVAPVVDQPPIPHYSRLLHVDARGNSQVIFPVYIASRFIWMGFKASALNPSTGKWGPAVAISSLDRETNYYLATDVCRATGRIVVVFGQYDTPRRITYAWETQFDPTKKTWTSARQIYKNSFAHILDAGLDSDGNGVLLFEPSSTRLTAHRLNGRTGTWGPAFDLFSGTVSPALIAMGAQGEALAVWDEGSKAIYARWFR